MSRVAKGVRVAVLGIGTLALSVPAARAQSPYFQVRPGLSLQQYAFNLATVGRALSNFPPYSSFNSPFARFGNYGAALSPYANMNAYANPYASMYANPSGGGDPNSAYSNGYGGYNWWYEDPNGAYLRGAAEVINSQGRFMVNQMQAYSLKEQVRSERIANRRRILDEYLYEREKLPTPEDDRQRFMQQQVLHARNNPPSTEVWSAKALNDLLGDLRKAIGKADPTTIPALQQPLDDEGLKRINVTSGRSNHNMGLLKNEGRLNWPVALASQNYRTERERINTLAQKAVRQAEVNGTVEASLTEQLSHDVDRLRSRLRKEGGDLPFALYSEARNYLDNLDDAIAALQQPDVGNYFNGKYALKGKTVGELIKFMADQGLQFAPAVPGDEAAYSALHQALASFDLGARVNTER
jgi:hypothetical protein